MDRPRVRPTRVVVLRTRATVLVAVVAVVVSTAIWNALAGVAAGFGVLLVGWLIHRMLSYEVDPVTVTMLGSDRIGAGSEDLVAAFEALGYRRVGALGFRVIGHQVVEAIMVGPDGDRYAGVTDAIIAITSRFGDHSVVSRNSARSALAPGMLDNPRLGASPAELDETHSTALALIDERPDPIDPDTVTATAVATEGAHAAWARGRTDLVQSDDGTGPGPVASDPAPGDRIARWRDEQPLDLSGR